MRPSLKEEEEEEEEEGSREEEPSDKKTRRSKHKGIEQREEQRTLKTVETPGRRKKEIIPLVFSMKKGVYLFN